MTSCWIRVESTSMMRNFRGALRSAAGTIAVSTPCGAVSGRRGAAAVQRSAAVAVGPRRRPGQALPSAV